VPLWRSKAKVAHQRHGIGDPQILGDAGVFRPCVADDRPLEIETVISDAARPQQARGGPRAAKCGAAYHEPRLVRHRTNSPSECYLDLADQVSPGVLGVYMLI
jgi:hypothetical protein